MPLTLGKHVEKASEKHQSSPGDILITIYNAFPGGELKPAAPGEPTTFADMIRWRESLIAYSL